MRQCLRVRSLSHTGEATTNSGGGARRGAAFGGRAHGALLDPAVWVTPSLRSIGNPDRSGSPFRTRDIRNAPVTGDGIVVLSDLDHSVRTVAAPAGEHPLSSTHHRGASSCV